MSRVFTGGAFNYITFGAGSAPTVQGPITLACLVKPATITGTHWWWTGRATSTHVWSILTDTSKLFIEGDFGTGGPSPTIANWWWVVVTKASGSALPRWHVKNVTTGGAWSHTNGSANVGNNTGPITNILFGGDGSNVGTNADMKGAAAAAWNTALSDLAVEAACTLSASALLAAAPQWMIRLNQASTATAVVDDTGGTGGQTAITGTTVDAADDPPGFNYALTTTITKDLTETYRVLNARTKDSTETYRVLNAGTKNSTETYRVFGAVTKNQTETYRVFGAVTKDLTEVYNVRLGVTKDLAETYRVFNSTTKDVSESYRVFAATTKSVTETYRVLGAVVADRAETYRVFGAVTADHAETYRVLNGGIVNRPETYRVLNGGTVDRVETYRVYNAFTKDLTELYSILSATGVVKNVAETYRIFNSVTKDQTEAYRVLGAVTKSVVETYRVLGAGTVDRSELYRVFNGTVVDRAEAYRIFNARSRDFTETYSILGVSLSKDVTERYRILNARLRDVVERYNVGPLAPITVTIDATTRLDLGVRVGLTPAFAVAILNRWGAVAHLDEVS